MNPNYTLVNLRPEGFNPKVSGLAFLGNGDLAVLTTGSVNPGDGTPRPPARSSC